MASEDPIRIATVYVRRAVKDIKCQDMADTRWIRISEALARVGHEVDIIVASENGIVEKAPRLRYVPYSSVNWTDYDVIKTLFHAGFDTLAGAGGSDHPFIISKMGSVVGTPDSAEGTHFFGEEREKLFETERKILERSRYVTILTEASRVLWEESHGRADNLLLVPTGVDEEVPPPGKDPYADFDERIAVYIGNFYSGSQREVNIIWQDKLNALGRLLRPRGIRLCVVGRGASDRLDSAVVTHLGPVENDRVWDYHYYADVGIVLAQGDVQHNESSKIYYYLRSGLPVVSEAPVPNNHLIAECGLGSIADYSNDEQMAEQIEAAVHKNWDRKAAIDYILEHHTWDARARIYDKLLREQLP